MLGFLPPWVTMLALAFGFLLGGALTLFVYGLPSRLRRQWRGRPARPVAGRLGPARGILRAIPVVGWWLQGRYDHGYGRRRSWGWRYPALELLLAMSFALCAWRFGIGWRGWSAMGFCATLLVLAWVDWRSGLLPDRLTLPLLWGGLLINLEGALAPLPQAVLGAVIGYGCLWLFFHAFKCLTGREGMGYGDFKLTAALGAWLGWEAIPGVLLLAALAAVAVGSMQHIYGEPNRMRPFGPYLALAAICGLMLTD